MTSINEIEAYFEVFRAQARSLIAEGIVAPDAYEERIAGFDRTIYWARKAEYEQCRNAVNMHGSVSAIELVQRYRDEGRCTAELAGECIDCIRAIASGMKVTEFLDSESARTWLERCAPKGPQATELG
jgi:hypothetical protein